jgi:outer membrane protein assembly factor BamE (lipoprotein component of BamABCDE complex)
MNTTYPKRIFAYGLTAIALTALVSGGCSSRVYNHGNQLDPLSLSKVEPGKTPLIEVEALFGKPSATGAFDSGKVYYITQIMEEKPGARKETINRTIVAFSYNDTGLITAIDITDEQTGRTIFHRDEKTPTPGNTYGILEQMFRNVQRGGLNQ